jgi:hypothetical protein
MDFIKIIKKLGICTSPPNPKGSNMNSTMIAERYVTPNGVEFIAGFSFYIYWMPTASAKTKRDVAQPGLNFPNQL